MEPPVSPQQGVVVGVAVGAVVEAVVVAVVGGPGFDKLGPVEGQPAWQASVEELGTEAEHSACTSNFHTY